MSASEQNPPNHTEAIRRKRARYWWQICIVACCLFPVVYVIDGIAINEHDPFGRLISIVVVPLVMLFLPVGLLVFLGGVLDACVHGRFHGGDLHLTSSETNLVLLLVLLVPYGIFALHWYLTLNAKTQRAFHYLIWLLVALVTASLIGCAYAVSQPLGLQ